MTARLRCDVCGKTQTESPPYPSRNYFGLRLEGEEVEEETTELEKDDDALKKAIRKMKEFGGGYRVCR